MINELDKNIIRLIQGDLPVNKRPFAAPASQIGITEAEFIERVSALKRRGIIRRFGATLRHQEAGFRSNAMVAWQVPDARIEEVGKRLARFREVTHCYHRRTSQGWPYNLYTMIHGNSKEQCKKIAARMSEAVGTEQYSLLFSEKEFKKTSMQYF